MAKPDSEEDLLRRIQRSISGRDPRLQVGIGDDCAVLRLAGGPLLVSTDLLQQDVHFDLRWTTPFLLGYKALAVNASDIGAMGGRPIGYLVSLGLPEPNSTRFVDRLYAGLGSAGRRMGVTLCGGDLCRSPAGVILSVSIFGETAGRRPVLRSGARPGDWILATGVLGISAIGLELLRRGARGAAVEEALRREASGRARPARETWSRRCLRAHLAPAPPLALAADLGAGGLVSSMIDRSDGLSLDLRRLCRASKTGARLERDLFPVCPAGILDEQAQEECVLHGGEDYGLLFTVRPREGRRLQAVLRKHPGIEVTRIGTMTAQQGRLMLRRGSRLTPLECRGFDHFRKP